MLGLSEFMVLQRSQRTVVGSHRIAIYKSVKKHSAIEQMSQTRAQLVKGFSNTSGSDDTITVDSSGQVGVGQTSPAGLLHISKSGGNAKLLIQRSNTAANTNDYGSILWQSSAGNNNAAIGVARHSAENDGYMFFSTASGGTLQEELRIQSAGGISFNGDTAAANALDDYEEGDWTPDLQFGGAKVGITYNNQYGKYVKIGRLVHVFGRINLSSKGSSSGNARFFGLPYVTETITGTTMNIGSIWYSGFNLQGSIVQVVMRTDGNGQSFIEPKGVTTNTEDAIGDSDFTNSTDMCFSVTYRTT